MNCEIGNSHCIVISNDTRMFPRFLVIVHEYRPSNIVNLATFLWRTVLSPRYAPCERYLTYKIKSYGCAPGKQMFDIFFFRYPFHRYSELQFCMKFSTQHANRIPYTPTIPNTKHQTPNTFYNFICILYNKKCLPFYVYFVCFLFVYYIYFVDFQRSPY